jgi:hypothetical protein
MILFHLVREKERKQNEKRKSKIGFARLHNRKNIFGIDFNFLDLSTKKICTGYYDW